MKPRIARLSFERPVCDAAAPQQATRMSLDLNIHAVALSFKLLYKQQHLLNCNIVASPQVHNLIDCKINKKYHTVILYVKTRTIY